MMLSKVIVDVTIPCCLFVFGQSRATRNGEVDNHIAEHHLQTKHQIDWDSATCVTYSTDYHQRLTLESWFTNLEQTTYLRDEAKLTTRDRLEN